MINLQQIANDVIWMAKFTMISTPLSEILAVWEKENNVTLTTEEFDGVLSLI